MNYPTLPLGFIFAEKGYWIVRCYGCCIPERSRERLVPMHIQDFKNHKQSCYDCKRVIVKPTFDRFYSHPNYDQYSSLNMEIFPRKM